MHFTIVGSNDHPCDNQPGWWAEYHVDGEYEGGTRVYRHRQSATRAARVHVAWWESHKGKSPAAFRTA